MTPQFSDIFILDGENYSISGINGGELYNPLSYGWEPLAVNTACWRGFVATYTLNDDMLVLQNISINLRTDGGEEFYHEVGPEINGKIPSQAQPHESVSSYYYENLELPIDFTGGILICQGFIPSLYVHMGFHPAWKYEKVIELLFHKGKLTEKHDASDKIREIRDKMIKKGLKPDLSKMDLSEWIDKMLPIGL